jgi:tripartite-type tricarboxylate transporter receptor subunit TctC
MHKILRLALAGTVALTPLASLAQEYPAQPITVINPNSAGGGTDVGIRTWQPYVEECLGGAALVPTAMPGGASAIGITALATAEPNGYTVGMVNMPNLVTNSFPRPDSPSIDDFVYIGNIIGVRSSINVQANSEFENLEEAIAYIESTDGPVNVGMGGVGADDHLVGLQLQAMIDKELNFIPFGSGADSRNALLGGQVEFALMSNVEAAGFREDVRPLAIASAERTELWPDVGTFTEQGYDIVGGSDHIIAARAGFPEEALEQWRTCIAEAAANPEFLADAEERALSLNIMDAAETEAFVREQAELLRGIWDTSPWVQQ